MSYHVVKSARAIEEIHNRKCEKAVRKEKLHAEAEYHIKDYRSAMEWGLCKTKHNEVKIDVEVLQGESSRKITISTIADSHPLA